MFANSTPPPGRPCGQAMWTGHVDMSPGETILGVDRKSFPVEADAAENRYRDISSRRYGQAFSSAAAHPSLG
jgi:hypothetical protein